MIPVRADDTRPFRRYLLLDRFLVDQAAPLESPRTCQPGPGQLTITDT